jgi:hypothetical protein
MNFMEEVFEILKKLSEKVIFPYFMDFLSLYEITNKGKEHYVGIKTSNFDNFKELLNYYVLRYLNEKDMEDRQLLSIDSLYEIIMKEVKGIESFQLNLETEYQNLSSLDKNPFTLMPNEWKENIFKVLREMINNTFVNKLEESEMILYFPMGTHSEYAIISPNKRVFVLFDVDDELIKKMFKLFFGFKEASNSYKFFLSKQEVILDFSLRQDENKLFLYWKSDPAIFLETTSYNLESFKLDDKIITQPPFITNMNKEGIKTFVEIVMDNKYDENFVKELLNFHDGVFKIINEFCETINIFINHNNVSFQAVSDDGNVLFLFRIYDEKYPRFWVTEEAIIEVPTKELLHAFTNKEYIKNVLFTLAIDKNDQYKFWFKKQKTDGEIIQKIIPLRVPKVPLDMDKVFGKSETVQAWMVIYIDDLFNTLLQFALTPLTEYELIKFRFDTQKLTIQLFNVDGDSTGEKKLEKTENLTLQSGLLTGNYLYDLKRLVSIFRKIKDMGWNKLLIVFSKGNILSVRPEEPYFAFTTFFYPYLDFKEIFLQY